MNPADLEPAASLAHSEGWVSQDRKVFEIFLEHKHSYSFVAEEDGTVIGTIVATSYGRCGFLGELIVREDHRGHGLGRELLMHATRYLQKLGAESVYLDGAALAVPLYARNGFARICPSLRFHGTLPPAPHPAVAPIAESDLPEIFRRDRAAFGADRGYFLRRRWELSPGLCLAYRQDGFIAGYLFSYRHAGGIAVGPWVVEPLVADPLQMLAALSFYARGSSLHLGVLETNALAVKLMRDAGFAEDDDVPWRMVYGKMGNLGQNMICFAVGAAAKG